MNFVAIILYHFLHPLSLGILLSIIPFSPLTPKPGTTNTQRTNKLERLIIICIIIYCYYCYSFMLILIFPQLWRIALLCEQKKSEEKKTT
jgi:hypothetical protein